MKCAARYISTQFVGFALAVTTAVSSPLVAQSDNLVCGVPFADWLRLHPTVADSGLVHEADVENPVEHVRSPVLEYPRALKAGGWQGLVELAAVVDPAGRAVYVEAVSTEVNPPIFGERRRSPTDEEAAEMFARAARQLLRETEFRAGSNAGQAVHTVICVPVQFSLVGG